MDRIRFKKESLQKDIAACLSSVVTEGEGEKSFTEDVFHEPMTFDASFFPAGANLERAYRFESCYAVLHKHGFPVPFAMNDFNPATDADAKARKQILNAIEKIKKELATDADLPEGSDAYRMALGRRLFDWVREETRDFRYELHMEKPDWLSFAEKSGKCTERSAILFYAYKKAGLDPSFFVVDSAPPTLSNYFSLREDTFAMGHAFVGFLMEKERRWIFVDLINGQFDASFPRAVRLTPRQYVVEGHLSNRLAESAVQEDFKKTEKEIVLLRRIAPQSCWAFMLAAAAYASQENSEKLERLIQKRGEVCSFYETMKGVQASRLELMRTYLKQDIPLFISAVDQQSRWLETISEREAALAAREFFFLGEMMLSLAKQNERESALFRKSQGHLILMVRAKNFWMRTIELNPQYLPAFYRLQEMYQRDLVTFDELFQFLHAVTEKENRHSVAHYLAAYMGLNAIKGKKFGMTDETFQKIIGHIETVSLLEPHFSAVQSLRTARLFFEGRLEEVVRLVEKIKKESRAIEAEVFYHQAMALLGLGRCEEALTVLRELLRVDPKISLFVAEAVEGVLENSSYNIFEDGSKNGEKERGVLSMPEREDAFRFFSSAAAMLDENPQTQKIAEKIRARLLVVISVLGADDFKVKDDLSAEARAAAENQWLGILVFVRKAPVSIEIAKQLKVFLPKFAEFFPPETGGHAMALGYLEVCRIHLLLGEEENGKSAFREAVRLSGDILKKEGYWERIVQELFEPLMQSAKVDEWKLDHAAASLSLADDYRTVLSSEILQLLPKAWSFLQEKYAASIVLEREEWDQERRSNFPTMHNASRKALSPK